MRLLNAETRELETFEGHDIPAYAVLSHTWASPQEEILFQDLSGTRTWYSTTGPPPDSPKAAGWKKLSGACRQASCDGLQYVWIDTCCIDKSSSAELSEAIISMYRWYAHSVVCYAYLADVYAGTDPRSDQAMDDFRESRWHTRGWTLQELLAPADVRFFDARWVNLGWKHMLCETISAITGINPRCISGLPDGAHRTGSPWDPQDPQHFIATASVAEKMSWAASRQTTRLEDMTYCLLGIFDVTMPILYGEGDRAFQRLQENIMGATEDCTLLAWSYQVGWPQPSGAWNEMKPSILAPSAAAFRHCRGLIPRKIPRHKRPAFSMTPRGLKLKLPVLTDRWHKDLAYAILACGPLSPPRSLASFSALNGGDEAYLSFMAIPLISVTPASDNEVEEYWRPAWSRPTLVTRDFIAGTVGVKPKATLKKIIIRRPSPEYDLVQKPWLPVSLVTSSPDTDAILQAYPPLAIAFRCVVSNILPPADAHSSGSLLNKLRRGSKDSRQDSASNAPEKLSYQPTNPRRLIYATVLDLHLLIYLQFGATSTPSETFVQQLHASEWPRKPHIKVFRLPSSPPIEDLHEWYDAKVPPKLSELPGVSTGPSDTEWHYMCERADGEVVSFKLTVGYEFREQVDRSGEVTSWDLMPVVKVSHDSGEEGEEADAWSIAETLT